VVVAAGAGAIAVATLLVLVLVPVPQHFTMDGAAIYDLQTTCPGIPTTQGTSVTFHWSASGFTYFASVRCSENQVVYQANGTSGSGTFVSAGGVYEFGSLCPGPLPCYPATVTGSYTGPLLGL